MVCLEYPILVTNRRTGSKWGWTFNLGLTADFCVQPMNLESLLLALMLQQVPPGRTQFSVEPAPQSESATWSDFYDTWVVQETPEHAERRYATIARSFGTAAEQLLCTKLDGTKLEDCVPHPDAIDDKNRPLWSTADLSLMTLAVAIQESGLREDVQVGRGGARKPSKDGGRGRGPGGEACLIQLHPTVSWRFAAIDADLRTRAEKGDRDAREAIQQALVGLDSEALAHCAGSGMRALLRARAHCAWAKPKQPWDWATVSMYATGVGCDPDPGGKVARRVLLYRKLRDISATMRHKPAAKPAPVPAPAAESDKPVSANGAPSSTRLADGGGCVRLIRSAGGALDTGGKRRDTAGGRGRPARGAAGRLGEVHAAIFELDPLRIHGDELEVLPAGESSRIRRLRSHPVRERPEHAELFRGLPIVEAHRRAPPLRLHAA